MTWINVGAGTHNAVAPWVNLDSHRGDGINPDVLVIPGEPLPYPDNSCERVLLSHVLEHIPWEALPAFLADVRRVACGEVLVVGPDVYRTLEAWRAGRLPWSLVGSVMEHKDHPDDMAAWPGAPHHWNCLSGDTEFLTDRGVTTLAAAADSEVTVLASPRGERGAWRRATIARFGQQPTYSITLARMGRTKVVRATADHRWFVRSGRDRVEATTATLKAGDQLASCRGHMPSNVRPSAYGIAAGITFGDGTAWSRQPASPAEVTLCGDKDAELLKYFPLSPTRVVPGVGITVCDLPRSWREIPSMSESLSYLYGWLLGYLAADGSVSKAGEISLASANRGHLEVARDVAVRLGIPTGAFVRSERKGGYKPGSVLHELRLPVGAIEPDHLLIEAHRRRARKRVTRPAAWRVVSVEEFGVEDVYCAVEPTTHTFTLADNILTGNCHEARVASVLDRAGFTVSPVLNDADLASWPLVGWERLWQFAIVAVP